MCKDKTCRMADAIISLSQDVKAMRERVALLEQTLQEILNPCDGLDAPTVDNVTVETGPTQTSPA